MSNTMPKIICPKCGEQFEMTSAIEKDIRENITKQFEEKYKEKEIKIEEKRRNIVEEINSRLLKERKEIKETARKELVDESIEENKLLKNQLNNAKEQIKNVKKAELEVEKLKDQLRLQETEIETKLRKEISKENAKIMQLEKEQYQLKIKEIEAANKQQMDSMKKTIEELKSKSEQKSPKIQGEVQENLMQVLLEEMFPEDEIKAIKPGKKGFDIIHSIMIGKKLSGKIAWESKKTKQWSNGWIEKMKDDIKDYNADIGVIVTIAMPSKIDKIGMIDNVWIVDFDSFQSVAQILRNSLIEIKRAQLSSSVKDDQLKVLYKYIVSNDFVSKIQNIVRSFKIMEQELYNEKKAMNTIWAKREKQMESVVTNIAMIYGELQGQLDNKLPEVKALKLIEE